MFLCGKIRHTKRKSHQKTHLTHCLQGDTSLLQWTSKLTTDSSLDSLDDHERPRVNKRRRLTSEMYAGRTAANKSLPLLDNKDGKTASSTSENRWPQNDSNDDGHDDDDDDDKENSLPSGLHHQGEVGQRKRSLAYSESLIVQTSLTYLAAKVRRHPVGDVAEHPYDVIKNDVVSTPAAISPRTGIAVQSSSGHENARCRSDSDKESDSASKRPKPSSGGVVDKPGTLSITNDSAFITSMSNRHDTVDKHGSLGKIKLTLSILSSKRLFIQVHEAIIDDTEIANPTLSIQALLIPDDSQKTLQEIQSTSDAAPWLFEEPIIYDLTGVNQNKRVLVCVKCTNGTRSSRKTLGCLSFGIKHLLSRSKKTKTVIDSWYHLLPDRLGNHKHITCNHGLAGNNSTNDEKESIKPNQNGQLEKKLRNTENYLLNVTKFRGGYGFTIKGVRPVCVGRVKSGGAAEQAGLKNGDYILNINNEDATLMSLEAVANIVRTSAEHLQVYVARRQSGNHRLSGLENANCWNPQIPNTSGLEEVTPTLDESVPCLEAARKIASWGLNLSQDLLGGTKNPALWQPELSVIQEERSTGRSKTRATKRRGSHDLSCSLWQPDLSHIALLHDTTSYRIREVQGHVDQGIYEEIGPLVELKSPRSWDSMTPDTLPSCQPDSFTDTELSDESHLFCRHNDSYDSLMYQSRVIESVHYNTEATDCSKMDSSVGVGHLDREQLPSAAGRQAAVHRLLTIEEDFMRIMKRGMQRFSRPLRHQLLSRSQHATLFQNIEKLIMFSEFHICQMINKTYCAEDSYMSLPDGAVVDMVGNIYKTKIAMVCDAYQMYAEGLNEANQLLQTLKQNDDFQKFLLETTKDGNYGLDLEEFIQQPICHYQQLVCCLGEVLSSTPQQHADYNSIKQVLKVICRTISKPGPSFSASHCHGNDTGYYNNVTSARRQCCAGSSSASVSTNLSSNVDSEIADLQTRISFSGHVKPFVIATPRRHVILSGQLLCLSKRTVTPFWVILCNDLLLLTEKDVKGQLRVTEEPIALQQIQQADFDCVHPAEFHISCHKTFYDSRSADWTTRDYKFRATNMEEKYAWKAVLEQRIQYSKSRTDSAYASMEEIL